MNGTRVISQIIPHPRYRGEWLTTTYAQEAEPVIELQLEKGGIRLAHLLIGVLRVARVPSKGIFGNLGNDGF